LLKPDGVKKQLLAELLVRTKIRSMRVTEIRTITLTPRDVDVLYGQHRERKSYEPMKAFLTQGSCVAIRVEGRNAVAQCREMIGTGLFPYPPRTFRGTYATTQWRNVVHASDSPETAERELGYIF
jgi:nucleoside-diphosphate kinase